MRGDDEQQASVWSYIPLEQRVPVLDVHAGRPLDLVDHRAHRPRCSSLWIV